MMMNFISNMSEASLLIFLLTVTIALSLACFFLIQKYCTWLRLDDDGIFGTIFANTMPTLVGFVFAFVTVAAWQNYNTVSDAVSKEAHTLFNLYQIMDAYPNDTKKAGQEELINYAQAVIDQEWPILNQQKFDLNAFKSLDRIKQIFVNHKPSNFEGIAIHNEGLSLLSDYTDLRRNRIESAKSFLAKPMWAALIISAILLILFSALFKTKNIRIHAVMIALVGGSLGVMFFLLVLYDNPFWGPSAIEPAPFQKTLESISIIKR
jgi:hypothetical protein